MPTSRTIRGLPIDASQRDGLTLNAAYRSLARARVEKQWPPYQQPEDFGYDFRDWVSPYTKGAHTMRGLAIVLQDWASAEGLADGPSPDVQALGRTAGLLTNRRLEAALRATLGLTIADTFATNVFPFVKPGGMSAAIPMADLVRTATEFTRRELAIVQPTAVVALGRRTHDALTRAGVNAMHLPHPAARGMSSEDYRQHWARVSSSIAAG